MASYREAAILQRNRACDAHNYPAKTVLSLPLGGALQGAPRHGKYHAAGRLARAPEMGGAVQLGGGRVISVAPAVPAVKRWVRTLTYRPSQVLI